MLKYGSLITVWLLLIYLVFMPNWSCKKTDTVNNDTQQIDTIDLDTSQNTLGLLFEYYVLNKPTQITLAIDSTGNNITPTYADYEINLKKETFFNGPLEILANGTKYVGTWQTNGDYSRLTLNISGLKPFGLFNRTWRFTYKSIDLLKISPVTNPGETVLHLSKI